MRVKPHGDKVRGALRAAHVAPAHKAPRGRAAGIAAAAAAAAAATDLPQWR